jgi:hypothetical protein
MFLCYDIKGIQRFIFSVPKLKCIVGASSLIADFDDCESWISSLEANSGVELIFSGGGRGLFKLKDSSTLDRIQNALLRRAHASGLDIRFGHAPNLMDAVHGADELYPFYPTDLSGEPCTVSGIWPTNAANGVHPMIQKRIDEARHDALGKQILAELTEQQLLAQRFNDFTLEFFRNVNPRFDEETNTDEINIAKAAYNSLGSRNRWAIVAMDGNDMGKQFDASDATTPDETSHLKRLKTMSKSLNVCTFQAFLEATSELLNSWIEDLRHDQLDRCTVSANGVNDKKTLILPIRPLILGGDDVTLLCHGQYAMQFVATMSTRFTELSKEAAEKAKDNGLTSDLWPATSNKLTISAGVLFAKSTFPLSIAIPYAESLLANAKASQRGSANKGQPMNAAVDWETITDTLVDTPAERRYRELVFEDSELNKQIELTRKPYVLGQQSVGNSPTMKCLREVQDIFAANGDGSVLVPKTIQAELVRNLQRPWSDRIAFIASLAKRHPELKKLLWEGDSTCGSGWYDTGTVRSTMVLDALSLLDEQQKYSRPIPVNSQ